MYDVSSLDMDVGWVYTIESGSTSRTITVIVAGGRRGSSELPHESRRAIETHGRSAVEAVQCAVEAQEPFSTRENWSRYDDVAFFE